MFFVLLVQYGRSCTVSGNFRVVKAFCRRGTSFPSYQPVLDFVQHVGLFKNVHGCTLHIPQPYLVFRLIEEADWNSDGNVKWLRFSAGHGVVYDISAGEVSERKRSFHNEAMYCNILTVKVCFVVDHSFSLTDLVTPRQLFRFLWRSWRTATWLWWR